MKQEGKLHLLDELDWSILRILQENSKQTYTEIGHRLDLAHSTIYDRIKKMEESSIIRKYSVVIDPRKAGVKLLTAILTIFTNPKESEKVAQELVRYKEVLKVFSSLSEELCIIAEVVAEDQEQLHSFIAQSVAPMPGVLRIRTSIVTRKYKEETLIL